jgi:2-polyprenyl-6-methoxyphenol hydroxylase-like FAD-dependent oxidoreductase
MSDKSVSASPTKVGIVGGSIAGCVTAVELMRIGCDVTLFERSRRKLEDRGAGIALSLSLIQTLKERDLVDSDMAHIPLFKRPFIVRSESDDTHLGRTLWSQDAAFGATNWDVLYRQLRRRVPDGVYIRGSEAKSLSQAGSRVSVTLADGQRLEFDMVVCADGHDSLGRKTLMPDRAIEYAGYILWRGLIDESNVPDIGPFENVIATAVYDGGHVVFYIVPGRNGELEKGKRRLNWAMYENVADTDLPRVLTDFRGVVHRDSLPPGTASSAQISYIHNLAQANLYGTAANAICATSRPFIQTIYEMSVPYYHKGRVCLIGDASTLARPHTGAGSVKAMTDAIALSKAIETHESLDEALEAWDGTQSVAGIQLVALGRSLGEAMVTDVPDWKSMNEDLMKQWFATVMSDQRWYAIDEAAGRG